MNRADAVRLHVVLLQAVGDEVTSAVVKLHAPDEGTYAPKTYAECDGCDPGIHAESGVDWPCRTILTINAYAHVDEIGYLP